MADVGLKVPSYSDSELIERVREKAREINQLVSELENRKIHCEAELYQPESVGARVVGLFISIKFYKEL